MKSVLTREQSQHLIDLGIDPKLATREEFVPLHPEVLKGNAEYASPWGWFPLFTLSDILNILPKEIDDARLIMGADNEEWDVRYSSDYNIMIFILNPEFIDALYELLIWCINKRYYKDLFSESIK